jgi:hypothetical protein
MPAGGLAQLVEKYKYNNRVKEPGFDENTGFLLPVILQDEDLVDGWQKENDVCKHASGAGLCG